MDPLSGITPTPPPPRPDGPAPPPPAPRRSLRAALVAGATLVVLAAGAGLAYKFWPRPGPAAAGADEDYPDPRLTYTGPFENVRPDVRYVGSARCAGCHRSKAESYRRHPMGRSLVPVAELAPRQPYDKAHNDPFDALGLRFWALPDGDRVRHRQARLDDHGQEVYHLDMVADYAIGSGTRGYSYLTNRGGFLFQTPISWFSQKQKWNLSPGFHDEHLAGRTISHECLFCHTNRVRHHAGTVNRFDEPLFDGHAIGCERCHGPGERHVQARRPGERLEDLDPTIVNPRHLTPALREAICEQCHLEGEERVVHRGRDFEDFRPGLPLSQVLSVFVRERKGGKRAVSQVEQMHESRCYQDSTGENKLGCVSCHDPHRKVEPERQIAYYRRRCLQCHQDGSGAASSRRSEATARRCSVAAAEMRTLHVTDRGNCIACHMPRYGASDIPHTATTDHRIVRRPEEPAAHGAGADEPFGDPVVLVPFYRGAGGPPEGEVERDRGLAECEIIVGDPRHRNYHAEQALARLEVAIRRHPSDPEIWEAKGRVLAALQRPSESLAAFETVLKRHPDRELSLFGAGFGSQAMGQTDRALGYWRRLVAVSPYRPLYRGSLVMLLQHKQLWDEARDECRKWLEQEPGSVEARKVWIACLLQEGRTDQARAEFHKLEALHPRDLEEVRTWLRARGVVDN